MTKNIFFIICLTLICLFANTAIFANKLPSQNIMFIQAEKGSAHLAVFNMKTGKTQKLTQGYFNPMYPRHSQTGKVVGFTNKDKKMNSEIHLFFPEKKKTEKVAGNSALEGFSPDGKKLLYTACNTKGGLYVYDIATKKSKLISKKPIISASWSNDGQWIAASIISKSGKTDLIKISLPSYRVTKITDTAILNESFPMFTKDGRYFVFFIGRNRDNTVAYYNLKTGKITPTKIKGRNPSMSGDNRWVVFERKNQIFICDKDGKNLKKITNGKNPIWF
jgi:Tol biopolymer transport system component